ncbi:MAG: Transcriptional regulator, AsnC family [Candidatus Wolfebacteria bacterium GW2011_GWC2_39_22]|uniref:Transcriptional regulator, AsnC family n=1 Tax=Candidatus Wolfebacteria bacterium GW2011_GWC2_39_22 TaxID=1619013 RepID=A0A0G0RF36_9BACT|nr:MAG: Transcriptional regulator, AsnC family [Candidatus Wolfebacteria bacterium GW2011_GWC2_39_22]HBI25899.1 hypothetical protein [Candidatus Wolfebacteria bacterium]
MNVTELDKKILFQLDQNGRASFSEIARAIGTSPQVVKYHYEQLMERGVIKHFWAFIDYDKADYSFFWGYWLKFSGLSKEKEQEIYAYLNADAYTPIVMRSDGYADVFLCFISKDIFSYNEMLQKFFTRYGEYVASSDIFVGLGFIQFPRTYLIDEENHPRENALSGGTTEKAKLTELDRKMISLLLIDGRMEFTKIASVLGVSVGLVHKHYAKLVATGVITKISFSIDYQKIGLLLYRVCFKIMQFDQKRIDDLYAFCSLHPNIINYVKGMGSWELLLDIEIEDRDALRNLIRDMKNQFKDIFQQVEINEIYQVDKFTQMAMEYPDLIQHAQPYTRGTYS